MILMLHPIRNRRSQAVRLSHRQKLNGNLCLSYHKAISFYKLQVCLTIYNLVCCNCYIKFILGQSTGHKLPVATSSLTKAKPASTNRPSASSVPLSPQSSQFQTSCVTNKTSSDDMRHQKSSPKIVQSSPSSKAPQSVHSDTACKSKRKSMNNYF